jgi:alpha-galactosidase
MARRLHCVVLSVSTALAAACLLLTPGAIALGEGQPELLTPKAPPTPQIHGPKIYGARPGHAFLYRIPCTGARPIHFSAKGLPASLKLDEHSGIISGTTPETRGAYPVILEAVNGLGKTARPFKIVVGDTLSLTPQMGWNDWYTHYEHPSDSVIRKAADAMIASGMADYGYQFVDVDDAWERKPASPDPALAGPVRDAQGNILPNRNFPDMAALTAYIHSLGLRTGIYSSPGPVTCGGFEASHGHESADAQQIAAWGFDLLKYDMCSYNSLIDDKNVAAVQEPYRKMGAIVKALDRDVVLNMCEYGEGDVWKWGREAGGSSWRTTGDVGAEPGSSLPGFYSVGFANAALSAYAGPGGWNDPDYLLIGMVGDAHQIELPAKPTSLTPDEQYSYMSMWSLMASPLFFSGDMAKLDAFTLNVLCNSEVIDIDQDSLGKQARIVRKTPEEFILAKSLEDGSVAVGLFNLNGAARSISVDWKDVAKSGKLTVRDVWRQRDIGAFTGSYTSSVPAHGVVLVRLRPVS